MSYTPRNYCRSISSKYNIHKIRPHVYIYTGYSPPLTNLAAQTEFSQPQKDCSGSSKDAHGL